LELKRDTVLIRRCQAGPGWNVPDLENLAEGDRLLSGPGTINLDTGDRTRATGKCRRGDSRTRHHNRQCTSNH
jgi:hypothetical protein